MTATLTARTYGNLTHSPATDIGYLRDELEDRALIQTDIKVTPDQIRMNDDGIMEVKGQEFKLRDYALTQVANKLHIPTQYLKRCEPDLRSRNVNTWLAERKTGLLVRTEGQEIRSVLSDQYRVINHIDILNWLTKDLNDSTQVRYELTERYLNLQVIAGNNLDESQDILHNGIDIRNSEVGSAAVSIGAMVYRTICLNGLVMSGGKWSYSRNHIGNKSIVEMVRRAYDRALMQAKEARDQFDGLRNIKVAQPIKALELLAKRYTFTAEESEAIKSAFNIEAEDTMFGVVNALTRAGNNTNLTVDSRHRLQKTGGRVTELVATGKWLD